MRNCFRIAVCLTLVTVCHAQIATTTALVGTVTDSSGRAIAGAKITATDVATQTKYTGVTNESGNYRLGMKTFEAATVFTHHLGLVRQARPVLEQLTQVTGEAAYLGVLEGSSVVCVDMVEATQPVRVVSHLGRRLPAHAVALGKAQLAFRSPEEREDLWKRGAPASPTGRTILEPSRLADELVRVVEREWAVEDEEFEPGVRALAAPVRDYARRVVGAIGVRGPAFRLSLERLETEVAPRIRAAARDVSKRLGFAVLGD